MTSPITTPMTTDLTTRARVVADLWPKTGLGDLLTALADDRVKTAKVITDQGVELERLRDALERALAGGY